MEDIGKLQARYLVVKTDGIFSKNQRFVHICDQGMEFKNVNYGKAAKTRDICLFKDLSEDSHKDYIILSDRNEKDFGVKAGKQSFTISCTDRVNLLTDILLYKEMWDLANIPSAAAKMPFFKGFRQVDLSDTSSKVQVTIQLLRSSILVTYEKAECEHPEERKDIKIKKYVIRYGDIEAIVPIPAGLIFYTKSGYEKYFIGSEQTPIIMALLNDMPKKHLGISIPVKSEQNYPEEKFAEVDEFSVPSKQKKFGGIEKSIRIHTNSAFFIEEDAKDNRVILNRDLSSIMSLKIKQRPHGLKTLKLYFPHKVQNKYDLKENELDYLISNILHSLQTKEDSDYVPFIFTDPVDLNMKIYAMAEEMDSSFITSLKKEIEEAASQGDILDEHVKTLLLDAALNANFKSLGYDAKFLGLMFALLSDLVTAYIKLEDDPSSAKAYAEYIELLEKSKHAKSHEIKSGPGAGRLMYEIQLRIPPLLAVIRNILAYRTTFPDFSTFQKQVDTLFFLTGSKHSIVSINACLTLRSILKSNDKKSDSPTRKWIVRDLDVISKISDVMRAHMEKNPQTFLAKFFSKDEIHECSYLQLYGLISIFEIIFMDKREAHGEDLMYIVGTMIDQDNVLNLIEQLLMYNSKAIVYQASLITAQLLLLLYNNSDKDLLTKRQDKILMYTSILLWNVKLLLQSSSGRQPRLSASIAALVVTGNNNGCNLISRLFPKSLLKKVDAGKKQVEWKPENWKELFVLVQNDYSTATEQWNEECRKELTTQLKKTALDYLSVKYKKAPVSEEEKIRWNHEEYTVTYNFLEQKCKVGKFYLGELFKGSQGLAPYLSETVMKPVPFWNVILAK